METVDSLVKLAMTAGFIAGVGLGYLASRVVDSIRQSLIDRDKINRRWP